MDTLQDLFHFVFARHHDRTVVFTNLGRKPRILSDFLHQHYADVDVVVASPFYPFPPTQNVRIVPHDEIHSLRGDLLLICEPPPHSKLKKPEGIGRFAVFSSHLVLSTEPDTLFASYFHFPTGVEDVASKIKRLVSVQDPSIQTRHVRRVQVDHVNVQVVEPTSAGTFDEPAYAIVDLTRPVSSKFQLLLGFWDAFERMLDVHEHVDRWVVCFPEKAGVRHFEQIVQDVIDHLYCVEFEHGNVRDLRQILSLLPFYKSGVVDRTFDVVTESFFDIEYVAPETSVDLYKAGTKYNLEWLVGSVYRVLE